jgi:TetR/AcrR family transcriptional repressor of nem operon
MAPRGDARSALLDAGIDLIRRQGLAATSVDDVCRAAGVTKGAFFHHFSSKEAYAIGVAERWTDMAAQLFAEAGYHALADPLDRVLAYVDLREQMIGDELPAAYSCAVGTMVQESFDTHPAVREACAASIFGHAATLEADLAAALEQAANLGPADAAGLARFTQAALQGAFIVGKAGNDAALAREAVHYLRELLVRVLAPANQEEPIP